jgi:excisionase family DNA binding protein
MDAIEPHTMTLQSAVQYTGLSKATLNRLVARGELQKLHVGKRALFRVADLKALVERAPIIRRRMPPSRP